MVATPQTQTRALCRPYSTLTLETFNRKLPKLAVTCKQRRKKSLDRVQAVQPCSSAELRKGIWMMLCGINSSLKAPVADVRRARQGRAAGACTAGWDMELLGRFGQTLRAARP